MGIHNGRETQSQTQPAPSTDDTPPRLNPGTVLPILRLAESCFSATKTVDAAARAASEPQPGRGPVQRRLPRLDKRDRRRRRARALHAQADGRLRTDAGEDKGWTAVRR